MKSSNLVLRLILVSVLVSALFAIQVGVASGASAAENTPPIRGNVIKITLESDPATGVTTVLVKVKDGQHAPEIVRLSQETAKKLGLVTLDSDGNPVINKNFLGLDIEIDPTTVLPNKEPQHPVAITLATFFSDIDGLDYETIMAAHEDGNGFGVIAQALWMIRRLDGSAGDLTRLLQAKEDGNFGDFQLKDGTVPTSWNELRRAVADNLGTVISHKDKENNSGSTTTSNNGNASNNNGNGPGNASGNGNGNGHGNGNGNGHGNANGNGNGNGNNNGNGNGNGNRP